MKKTIMKIIILLASVASFSQTKNDLTLLKETVEKYKNHKSISYDLNYIMKSFDDEIPFLFNTHVDLVRNTNDTIFGGMFLYKRNDSFTVQDTVIDINLHKFYDLKQLYIINHLEKKITSFEPSKGETFPITGSTDGDALKSYFLNIQRLEKSILNGKVTFHSDRDNDKNFLKITQTHPDEDEFYGYESNFYINKKTKNIEKITFKAQYKDQIQTNNWEFNNIQFDKVQESDLKSATAKYFEEYARSAYEKPREEYYNLLNENTEIPVLKGKLYPDYVDTIISSNNKILILDFWYTSCMPCIEAIPHLNKLYEKYKNNVEIIGVNPVETTTTSTKKIEAFLKRTPVNYPILFVEKAIQDSFKVKVFPSLYIIDKNGVIQYSKLGTSKKLYEELEMELIKLIGE